MTVDQHKVAEGEFGKLAPVVKAHFVGMNGGTQSTVVYEEEKVVQQFSSLGALSPAYDPNVLALIYENSSALRPNVEAYVNNIDGFGHAFIPVIETTALDADDKIRDALRIERARAKSDPDNAENDDVLVSVDEPTDKEVEARKKLLDVQIRTERAMLHVFFENCTFDMPFAGPEGLRGLTRQDIEIMGNGYWEVLRDGLGDIVQFNYVPAISVRLMPQDREPTDVEIERRMSLLSTEKLTVRKRFRRFVQIATDVPKMLENSNFHVFFKEFGDPRTVSSKTGKVYKSLEAMKAVEEEKDAKPATEILSFKISSPRSSYGVPRWIGTLLSVLGNRQAEEVNLMYFENRSVPPMAILVSGGRLNDETVKRLEDYISTEIKGKNNFHKIMILEAESAENASAQQTNHMKIEIRPLTDAQQKDALFQSYDERNADKVGQSFRLPRILRGDVRDFNRSTAEASIDFAEIQVFGPIRQQFDWIVNKMIFPALGVKYHTFRSNAPTVRDPNALARMIALLASSNVITPAEARNLAQDVFNCAFDNLDDDWVKQPLAITLARLNLEGKNLDAAEDGGAMSAGNAGNTQSQMGVQQKPKTTPPDRKKPKPKSDDPTRAQAKADAALADEALAEAAANLGPQARAIMALNAALLKAAKGEEEEIERVTIKVPQDEWDTWWVKSA